MATVQHATDAIVSEQFAQGPKAPKYVSCGSSVYSQAMQDHSAGPSQGSSDAQANSEGTTVTPLNHDDPAKLLRELITPAGFRLGPKEGWKSSDSSMVRYQPNVSSSSSPRRLNPKSSGLMGSLAVPIPKVTPEYENIAEYQGLKLCRVSDAVPFLLGPWTLVDRIQVILESGLKFADSNHNVANFSSDEPQPYSDRDRALMAILSGLQTPELNRRESGNWYPQGLPAKKGQLRLYKHTGPGAIKVTHVKLAEFFKMAHAWQRTPNPARLASDHPDGKNSWANIASKLRARDVDLAKIDLDLYYDLIMKCPDADLPGKLDEIVQWSQDGTLDQRYNMWTQQTARFAAASRVTNDTDKGRLDGLYSKRYTHTYPMGRPRSEVYDLEKAERRATRASRGETLTEKPDDKVKGWWGKRKERRRSCYFSMFMALIFGSIIGSIVWAMASRSRDYTPAGYTG